MRVHFDLTHPAHVHVFKNCIERLRSRDVEILTTVRPKEVALSLLDRLGFQYQVVGDYSSGRFGKAKAATIRTAMLLRLAKRFRPDVMMGLHNPYVSCVSSIVGVPSIVFIDSEPVASDRWVTHRFSSWLVTPRNLLLDLGRRQIRVDSFKELGYLHPNQFSPDPRVLDELSISPGDRYFTLRFSAFRADHDRGHSGFSLSHKLELVSRLRDYGHVFVSSESTLPSQLEKYNLPVPPHRFHDVLAYSNLLVTDSQTTATEAAILGTPSVRSNTLVGTMSNFNELENVYGLLYSLKNPDEAIALAVSLASTDGVKDQWAIRRKRMLQDKIDLTEFLIELIESVSKGKYRV